MPFQVFFISKSVGDYSRFKLQIEEKRTAFFDNVMCFSMSSDVAGQILKRYSSSRQVLYIYFVHSMFHLTVVIAYKVHLNRCAKLRMFPSYSMFFTQAPKNSSKRSNLGSNSAYQRTHCAFCILLRREHRSQLLSASQPQWWSFTAHSAHANATSHMLHEN